MTVFAYRRMSAFELADSGFDAVEEENAQILDYCNAHHWSDLQWQTEQADNWREGFSVRFQCPGLLQGTEISSQNSARNVVSGTSVLAKTEDSCGLNWLPVSGDTVVVQSLQRIFNSAEDAMIALEWMCLQQICLHVVDMQTVFTNPDTTLNANGLLRAMCAIESRRGAERMRSVKKGQRSKGRFLGGSKPFGYMIHANGKLIANPLEQRVLRQIRQLRKQGWSLRAIAEKVSTPVAPISFKTVQRVIQRED